MVTLLLLHHHSVELDVAVVHNQVFGKEAFQHIAVNNVELVVTLET